MNKESIINLFKRSLDKGLIMSYELKDQPVVMNNGNCGDTLVRQNMSNVSQNIVQTSLNDEVYNPKRDLRRYWNNNAEHVSRKLWLPIDVNFKELPPPNVYSERVSTYWEAWRDRMVASDD